MVVQDEMETCNACEIAGGKSFTLAVVATDDGAGELF